MSSQKQEGWYYASANGERLGPVSIRELGSLASKGAVGPGTLVWKQGYPEWIPAAEISDLLSAEQAKLSPPPLAPTRHAPIVENPETPARIEEAPVVAAIPAQELKPRMGSFIFPRLLMGFIASVVIAIITAGVLLATEQPPWPGLAVFAGGMILTVVATLAAYRKERYQIETSRLLCHRGGLLSDQTTELEIRNITHVKIKLPWLRYKFFGVGDVIIQTAGNSKPVVLRVIREPETVYAGLRERMKGNGYDLSQRQLLHEERPALIGILGECVSLLAGAILLSLFSVPMFVETREEINSAAFELALLIGGGLSVCLLIAGIIVRFLDLRRRTYRVYNDVVVYEEGFLTRENSFIPYENIADANTKCSFLDRILSLYDVQISCQGSGSEIKFRRLRHGVALSAAIDQIVVLAREKQKTADRSSVGNKALASRERSRRAEPAAVSFEETRVAELRMNAARTLVPLMLLLPLFPVWVLVMIQASIRLASTRYSVRHGSLRHSYRFLTVHDREFAYDKITGLVIKQNLWDRMFGTMTLRFWSIGSGQALEFAHVHGSQFDLSTLMRQAGIPAASAEPYEAKARFGLFTWLRARLAYFPLWVIFVAGIVYAAIEVDDRLFYLLALPFVIALIAFIRGKLYYSRQRLRFHDHHIEAEQGIIAKKRYFARYSNVKRNKSTRYPGGGEGDLEIFVAGEESGAQALQQKKNTQVGLKPCSFTTGFLPAVCNEAALLDDIISGQVEPLPQAGAIVHETLLEARRSIGNALFKLILASVIIFPLIALLPLTLPLTLIRVKRWRYRIEATRIVMSWGVLYRRETSILLDRVDSLQQNQGPLNKLFRNGNVSIMTAGSSKPDLTIIESPEYLAIHRMVS